MFLTSNLAKNFEIVSTVDKQPTREKSFYLLETAIADIRLSLLDARKVPGPLPEGGIG